MNKVDSFLVIIMILLSGFFVVYKTAEYQFSGVNFERQKNKQLVRRIQQLELEIKVAQIDRKNLIISGQSRQIASVAQPSKQNMIANRKLMDPSALAESYFKKAKQNCEKIAKEDLCTANIEAVVSQFPETRWAGESLVLLSRLYLKARHHEQAQETMAIVEREFKGDKEIQRQLVELKKGRF